MNNTTNLNPFDVTNAKDLTNKNIFELWADYDDSKSERALITMLDPCSLTSKRILGWKGCGKTHILRYLSYDVKKAHYTSIVSGIKNDGYIGILIKSEEMNIHRFLGKKINDEVWKNIFAYYFELWVAKRFIEIMTEFAIESTYQEQFCLEILNLFTKSDDVIIERKDFSGLILFLTNRLKAVDHAINNCIFEPHIIDTTIKDQIIARDGILLFNIPKILSKICNDLSDVTIIYMIDQYEDFDKSKQVYINTLIRNKKNRATFWIAARCYGFRTDQTDSANENNREGSEYTTIDLDNFYRDNKKYKEFAERMIKKRLETTVDIFNPNEFFYLEKRENSNLGYKEPTSIAEKDSNKRIYMTNFRVHLQERDVSDDIDQIIACISAKEYPLLEKAAIRFLYKNWDGNILDLSKKLQNDIGETIHQQKRIGKIKDELQHFKFDLMAQLYREAQNSIYTYGLDEIIALSHGNPRHLLTLLKKIYSWGSFYGKIEDAKISITSQEKGVKEASEWLHEEPKKLLIKELHGMQVAQAMFRLCDFFAKMFYSSKPSESSLCTIAINTKDIDADINEIIEASIKLQQIVQMSVHTDKNEDRERKFQLNRLLAPKFGLPIYSRGTISLSKDEARAIFLGENIEVLEERIKRMEPPFTQKKRQDTQKKRHYVDELIGHYEDDNDVKPL